ncbi:MAG: flagellar type III secretion system protein FlhB [Pseudomonadota bacterium]
MDKQTDESSKTLEPTPHKLNEARKKGEIARSSDLNMAAAYAGFLAATMLGGAASVETVGKVLSIMLEKATPMSTLVFAGDGVNHLAGILGALLPGLLIWFLMPALFTLASAFSQRSVIFAPTKIKPKLNRVGLVQNAKNKFGSSGLFEFSKSLLKLLLFSTLLVFFLIIRMPQMAGSVSATPGVAATFLVQIFVEFLFIVVAISVFVGAIDYIWQHYEHLRRNRMSHKEMKDENKEQDGDPTFKQERRQRGARIASQQIKAEVPSADVVIMNPTHYAVALRWSREAGSAPICVAKGVDHVALSIKQIAMDHNVPVRSDPPTARALFAATDVGQEIDPMHYRAVASAIRFAEMVRRKTRSRA